VNSAYWRLKLNSGASPRFVPISTFRRLAAGASQRMDQRQARWVARVTNAQGSPFSNAAGGGSLPAARAPTRADVFSGGASPNSASLSALAEKHSVEKLDPSAVAAAVTRFQHSVAAFDGDRNGAPIVPSRSDLPGKLNPMRYVRMRQLEQADRQRQSWEKRINDSWGIANSIGLRAGSLDDAYVYNAGSVPAAIAIFQRQSDHLELAWLTTHPGVAGAGKMMIEKGVNISENAGYGGKIKLTPLNDDAAGFYKSVGFISDGTDLALEPRKSNYWTLSGEWRLRRRV
jgi:hypothetical protein